MVFHESLLPADESHEISCLICYSREISYLFVGFEKAAKFEIIICCKLQVALYVYVSGRPQGKSAC